MRVFPKERRCANDNVDTVDTGLDCQPGVVHVTADVGEDLGLLETELADGLAVLEGFGRGGRRGELDVLYTKLVKPACELDTMRPGGLAFGQS